METKKFEYDVELRPYLRMLGFLSIGLFAIIPFQAAVYFISPPPTTVIQYFALFQKNAFLGFLGLDLSLTVDNLLFLLVYIGFYFLFRQYNRILVTIALIFAIISVALYVISREALFSMMNLSNQYSIASGETEKTALITVGQTMLTIFNGTCFNVSYFLGGLIIILFSIAMLKNKIFTKITAWLGLSMGLFMLIPPTFGKFGLILSFLSIILILPWLILIAIRFFKLSKQNFSQKE